MTLYWAFFFLTWLAAAAAFARQARRAGVPTAAIADAAVFAFPAVVVGAHLGSMVMGRGEVVPWRTFLFTLGGWRSGYASYGAITGALVALVVAARLHRLPGWLLLDSAGPGVFLASVVGRVGCFLTGCCFGAPTRLPWGLRFALDGPFPQLTPPSHPTQLYEIMASAVLGLALPGLLRRLRVGPGGGGVLCVSLGLFLAERFVLEFFRVGGTSVAVFHGFSKTHMVTFAGALACLAFVALERSRRRDDATPQPA